MFDPNLNWKLYLHELNKKVSRGIGLLFCKHEELITSIILFTYLPIPNLWFINKGLKFLQKRTIRIITFSKPDEHYEPLFRESEILKLTDLVTIYNTLFMYHYYYHILPSSFDIFFFQTVASIHLYNTRLASKSTYYINTIKTNYYSKFNIRFAAVKVWNHFYESIKHLTLKTFKNKVKLNILHS